MQCNACVEACPVGIEQAPIINQMRRRLVEEGEMPAELQSTLQVDPEVRATPSARTSAGAGAGPSELDFEVTDARKEPVDVLWFVGDYASFDPRSQKVTQALARLYHAAGVDFGILYDGERNAGNDVRRVGEEGLFEALAEENIGTLERLRRSTASSPPTRTRSTRCATSTPSSAASVARSRHHTDAPARADRGRPARPAPGASTTASPTTTPATWAATTASYDAPREILERSAASWSRCRATATTRSAAAPAAAGSGCRTSRAPSGRPRTASARRSALGELDYFVVACPKDVTMYEDAIKTSGNAERLELRELTELIEEEAVGAPAPVGSAA